MNEILRMFFNILKSALAAFKVLCAPLIIVIGDREHARTIVHAYKMGRDRDIICWVTGMDLSMLN